jgi:alpha-tubulin suppressor-like RCC1 family protein
MNLVRKVFYSNCCWTAPAGVNRVRAYGIPKEIAAISAGQNSVIALDHEGKAYAWGMNTFGQLGDGTTTAKCVPAPVSTDLRFVSVSAKKTSSIAVTCDGQAYSWGSNSGLLGHGTATNTCVPVAVVCGIRWKHVAIHNGPALGHTLGIDENNDGWAWGDNECGALGNGSITGSCTPVRICGGLKWKQFSAGSNGGSGGPHSIGITVDGDAYTWGDGTFFGALGNGNVAENFCCPIPVCGGLKWKQVVASCGWVIGITCEGDAYGWGVNPSGVLGNGNSTRTCCPVAACGGLKFKCIDSGFNHVLAITEDNDLYAWGSGSCGRLGNGAIDASNVPVAVCGGLKFKHIAAGLCSSYAVDMDGKLYSWGSPGCGALGEGTITGAQCCPLQIAANGTWRMPQQQTEKFIDVVPGEENVISVTERLKFNKETVDFFCEALVIEYGM